MHETTIETDHSFGIARDFDVNDAGEWVGVFKMEDKRHQIRFSDSGGFLLELEAVGSIVRFVGADRVLIVDPRSSGDLPNGYLFDRKGHLVGCFKAGDGIEDVIVLESLLAFTYFDEGIFGSIPPSNHGIAFFDRDGSFQVGYRTLFGLRAVKIADCYCACRVDQDTMAFASYQDFPLVLLKPRSSMQTIRDLPEALHGATALSMRGGTVYLYGPYKEKRSLYRWQADETPAEVGRYSGRLRGIEGGRFLSTGEHGFTVIDPAS